MAARSSLKLGLFNSTFGYMNRRARGVDNSIAFGAHFVLKHVAGKNSTVPCFHLNAVAIEGMKFAPRERFKLEKRGRLATEPSDVIIPSLSFIAHAHRAVLSRDEAPLTCGACIRKTKAGAWCTSGTTACFGKGRCTQFHQSAQ